MIGYIFTSGDCLAILQWCGLGCIRGLKDRLSKNVFSSQISGGRTDFGALPLAVCGKLCGPLPRAITPPAELNAGVKRNISTSFGE